MGNFKEKLQNLSKANNCELCFPDVRMQLLNAAKIGLKTVSINTKVNYKSFITQYLENESLSYECMELQNGIVQIKISW
jgi:hypothetical protein